MSLYSMFLTDSNAYAHYVFNTFDADHSGSISFEVRCRSQTKPRLYHVHLFNTVLLPFQEFVVGLSVLARGTLQDKLQWAFNLYDVNHDGIITKEEMSDIVTAIYSMMGKYVEPTIDEACAKDHVERIFQVEYLLYKLGWSRILSQNVCHYVFSCREWIRIEMG